MISIKRRAFLWTGHSFVSMLFIDPGIRWPKHLISAFEKLETEASYLFPGCERVNSFVWTQRRVDQFSIKLNPDDLCIECVVEIKHDTDRLPQRLQEDEAEKLIRWAQQKDDVLGVPHPIVGLLTPKYIYKDRVYPDAFS